MKNKTKKNVFVFSILLFLTLTFYSCQNDEVSSVQNDINLSPSKSTILQKYAIDLDKISTRIITSKGFLAFGKASNDYESIKLKTGKKSSEALAKLQNIKSAEDYEKFVNEYYQNPQKKLKQQEAIRNSLLQLLNEIPELKSFSNSDLTFTMGAAYDVYLKEKNEKYKLRSILDCKSNCQTTRDMQEGQADRQFVAYSVGCAAASPTLILFAICEIVIAYVRDDQYAVAAISYAGCVNGCPD